MMSATMSVYSLKQGEQQPKVLADRGSASPGTFGEAQNGEGSRFAALGDAFRSFTILPVIPTGWKEIARHLACGVRTAQRWEREGLPVKRLTNSSHSPVVAESHKLDSWICVRMLFAAPGEKRRLR